MREETCKNKLFCLIVTPVVVFCQWLLLLLFLISTFFSLSKATASSSSSSSSSSFPVDVVATMTDQHSRPCPHFISTVKEKDNNAERSSSLSSSSSPSTTVSSSKKTWAFLVGNCAEWEHDVPAREPTGDRGLYHALLWHLPASQIVFVQDDDCTQDNCQRLFEQMLQQTNPGDTLLFYYGGHGLKRGLQTARGLWLYSKIVNTVESLFRGSAVWFLLDCCYSGNLIKSIPPPSTTSTISYLCLASQLGDWEASDNWWSMTESMIEALKYCVAKEQTQGDLTIHEFVEYMADHHAVCKMDWFQATFHGGCAIDPMAPLQSILCSKAGTAAAGLDISPSSPNDEQSRHGSITSSDLVGSVTRFVSSLNRGDKKSSHKKCLCRPDIDQMDKPKAPKDKERWKRLVGLQPGDTIFAKWHGGKPPTSSRAGTAVAPYLLPMYYKATITKPVSSVWSSDDDVHVEFRHHNWRWTSTVSRTKDILPECCFYMHDIDEMLQAHCTLARYNRYLDASVPTGTDLWVWWDKGRRKGGKVYAATILAVGILDEPPWGEINKKLMKMKRYRKYSGPFVWVEWKDGDWDIVPKCHCLFQEHKPTANEIQQLVKNAEQQSPQDSLSPEQAMLRSMESMGRQFCAETTLMQGNGVTCYWDGAERKATLVDTPPDVNILAHHLDFGASGRYYCVRWNDDKSYSMIPRELILTTDK